MDISFLCLLVNHLGVKNGRLVDGNEDSQKAFEDALDEVFNDIVRRNFRPFETDPDFHVF